MNALLPLLLDQEESDDDKLKTMLMFQMMSQGSGLNIDPMMIMMLMDDQEESELTEMLAMILISSLGNPSGQNAYDNGFNMLLPMLLSEDSTQDSDDLMILLMMMQAQSPTTQSRDFKQSSFFTFKTLCDPKISRLQTQFCHFYL